MLRDARKLGEAGSSRVAIVWSEWSEEGSGKVKVVFLNSFIGEVNV